MLQITELQQCNQIIAYVIPGMVTIFVSILSLGIWICWDEWKMKKEDAQIQKSFQVPEPLEVEEIPRKYLYFQKLATQIHTQQFPINCSHYDTLNDLIQWMEEHYHKNMNDVINILHILENDEERTVGELNHAEIWLETAFYVWSINPKWIMPSWKPILLPRNRSWTIS